VRATSRQPSMHVEHVFSLSRRSNPAGGIFSQQSGDPFLQHHQMLPSAIASSPFMFHLCSSHQCAENTTNKSLTLLFMSGLISLVSAIQMRPAPMHPLPSRPSVSFLVRSPGSPFGSPQTPGTPLERQHPWIIARIKLSTSQRKHTFPEHILDTQSTRAQRKKHDNTRAIDLHIESCCCTSLAISPHEHPPQAMAEWSQHRMLSFELFSIGQLKQTITYMTPCCFFSAHRCVAFADHSA
jgi:hypothetical protein